MCKCVVRDVSKSVDPEFAQSSVHRDLYVDSIIDNVRFVNEIKTSRMRGPSVLRDYGTRRNGNRKVEGP